MEGMLYNLPILRWYGENISLWAHTFKNEGNVQLHSDVSLEAINVGTCSPSEDNDDKQSSWAKAVTRQIEIWEDKEVMQNLSGMYESMGSTYLKSLRRVMPITRAKMEWNVMGHWVVQTLCEGHDKDKSKHWWVWAWGISVQSLSGQYCNSDRPRSELTFSDLV